jgi:hypothetical protein
MAPQLRATKARSARGLRAWTARATSSLPVPLSPAISTLTSLAATRATRSSSARISALVPTMCS